MASKNLRSPRKGSGKLGELMERLLSKASEDQKMWSFLLAMVRYTIVLATSIIVVLTLCVISSRNGTGHFDSIKDLQKPKERQRFGRGGELGLGRL